MTSDDRDLEERLSIALRESGRADRLWRWAMANDARPENEGARDLPDRLRLDRLWRDRERARDAVDLLRAAIAVPPHRGRLWTWCRQVKNSWTG